jgi:uncharacterized repeat protein (TIGR01451 family)
MKSTGLGLILAAALIACPALASGAVELRSTVEKEIEITNAKGQKAFKREQVRKALPGDVLIYTVSYGNSGVKPAEKVVISNPVPEHMAYIADSALTENAVVTYSTDGGKTFDEPEKLVTRNAAGFERPATAADYTHIRWVLKKAVPPGEKGAVSFRARLK